MNAFAGMQRAIATLVDTCANAGMDTSKVGQIEVTVPPEVFRQVVSELPLEMCYPGVALEWDAQRSLRLLGVKIKEGQR